MRHFAEQFEFAVPWDVVPQQTFFAFHQWPACPLGAFAWWAVLAVHSRDTRPCRPFCVKYRARLPERLARAVR